MWAVRLLMRDPAAPRAGVHALERGPLTGDGFLDDQAVGAEVVVVLGIGDGGRERLADHAGGLLGR